MKLRLKDNRHPATITFGRKEKFKLTAHYWLEIVEDKAYVRNIFTDVITKFNQRGYYIVDVAARKRLLESSKLINYKRKSHD